MEEDIRFIHREETFDDLAVKELASMRANCIGRLQYGRCTETDCKHCATSKRIQNCKQQMSDYNKVRFDNYTSQYYAECMRHPDRYYTFNGLMSRLVFYFIMIIMLCLLPFVAYTCSSPCDTIRSSYASIPHELDSKIVHTIMWVRDNECDINCMDNNGVPNCIDMTLLFKLRWDQMYPDKKWQCQIVRNYNYRYGKKIMHHLFILINDGTNKIFVEPWSSHPQLYLMEDNWKSTLYNPKCNIYGETDKWMSEVNSGKAKSLLR